MKKERRKRYLSLYVMMIIAVFVTACTKGDAEQEQTNSKKNIQTVAKAEYTDGLIIANGLAFEVTEDVDNYTMSVFAIADTTQSSFEVPAKVKYEGKNYQVTAIGKSAFENESGLEKIQLPEGIQTIEESAFYDCSNLKEVVLPESLTQIKGYAFGECISLEKISFPNKLTEIGTECFIHCHGIEKFTIPGSVVKMGNSVFYECERLNEVIFEEGITDLSPEIFTNCSALQKVVLPETLLTIGNEAFWSCMELKTLEIPKNVASMGERCFYSSGITELTIQSEKLYPTDALFEGADEIEKIHVPQSSKESFQEYFVNTDVNIE